MRVPKKSEQIYQVLKSKISSRHFIPGSQLPTEPDLAEVFHSARNTVRKVLKQLETEGELVRRRGKGTFVRGDEPIPHIHFLLPHPEFMTWSNAEAAWTREVLSGALLAASENNCLLETMAVTSSNENTNIDLKRFDCFHENNMLIIPGLWFYPAFDFLRNRNCRVAVLNNQSYHAHKWLPQNKNWLQLILDRRSGIASAIAELQHQGCKKIAICHPFLDEPEHPVFQGYLQGIGETQRPYVLMYSQEPLTRGILKAAYAHKLFDGLIIGLKSFAPNCKHDVSSQLGISTSVKTVIWDYVDNYCSFDEIAGLMSFSRHQIGYDAVKMLLDNDPFAKTYLPAFSISQKDKSPELFQG